jgi:hypothetical protein
MTLRLSILSEDRDLSYPSISVKFLNNWSVGVCQSVWLPPATFDPAPPLFEVDLHLHSLLLSPGSYSVEVIVGTGRGVILDSWSFAETFSVIPQMESGPETSSGGVFFHHPAEWEIKGGA